MNHKDFTLDGGNAHHFCLCRLPELLPLLHWLVLSSELGNLLTYIHSNVLSWRLGRDTLLISSAQSVQLYLLRSFALWTLVIMVSDCQLCLLNSGRPLDSISVLPSKQRSANSLQAIIWGKPRAMSLVSLLLGTTVLCCLVPSIVLGISFFFQKNCFWGRVGGR